jgi:hypothetical protein
MVSNARPVIYGQSRSRVAPASSMGSMFMIKST